MNAELFDIAESLSPEAQFNADALKWAEGLNLEFHQEADQDGGEGQWIVFKDGESLANGEFTEGDTLREAVNEFQKQNGEPIFPTFDEWRMNKQSR